MKYALIVIIAMYLVFAITDIICCPIIYQKVFYRACKDSVNDDQDASVVSRKLAREFTFRFAFVPDAEAVNAWCHHRFDLVFLQAECCSFILLLSD